MGALTLRVLKEISFPEYRARHIFTAKLRLAIFIGFWFLYVIFLKDHLSETKPVTISILISFILTTIGYYNIFNNRYLIPSFALEITADLIGLTAIVYLTGGAQSEYYFVYIFYAVAAGLFYNYRLALFVSLASLVFYGLFLVFSYSGYIPPLTVSVPAEICPHAGFSWLHVLLLAIFLALAVYATKIAHHFTQIRERMLEVRNKELLALQQMSSTIRTVASLDNVLHQVVSGVLSGLDFAMCLLMLQDKAEGKIRCIAPDAHPQMGRVEEKLGVRLREIFFPTGAMLENEALKQVAQGRIIFRRDISEIVAGIKPDIAFSKFSEVQEMLGVKRIVVIPLVTGREVIGALIGFTREAFVEAQKVNTFQAFADQASLTIEAAMLISELRRKNIELVEANRVKSEFLATMSHELRTPLTAIIGFSELLLEGVMGGITEEQQDSLKEVLANGNNLLEMINNLLDLAKVDSGKMELIRHTFDWGEMIRRVEKSVAPLIKKKGHHLTTSVAPGVHTIFADEKRMQQIMLNLLSNAIKFTPENGNIKIVTEFFSGCGDFEKVFGHRSDIRLDASAFDKGLVVCSVEDNGIGIAPEHIPTIFDVFQQADSSATRSYEGSGLGLALVKQFVELHKGRVWVESEEGVGTKFSFVIPAT